MTSPTIDPLIMKRLAFIRLLYQQGVDQSHLPEPLTFTSVLAFHDAVELFLVLASEHLGATLPDHLQFMKYWTELHPNKLAGGVELSSKTGMDRLNRMRNGFKHAGTMPGLAAIEQARADVSAFLEDNTSKVFGIPFSGIDMADVVPDADVRDKIKAAVAANEAGDRREGMALLVEAFNEVFHGQIGGYRSPFGFGDTISWPLNERSIEAALRRPEGHSAFDTGPRDLARQIHQVTEVATAMQGALRVMAVGIDYDKYLRFERLTPEVRTYAGDRQRRFFNNDYAPNQEEFDYCHQFVITVALRMAEVEAHTIAPSWTVTEGKH